MFPSTWWIRKSTEDDDENELFSINSSVVVSICKAFDEIAVVFAVVDMGIFGTSSFAETGKHY